MDTDQRTPQYLAYLIRLWEADVGERTVWRASAESRHTGERHAFPSVALLLRFLEEQTYEEPAVATGSESGRPAASQEVGADG